MSPRTAHQGWFHVINRHDRGIASVTAFTMTFLTLVLGVTFASPAAAATPGISLTATGTGSVLLGDPVSYTLVATNPSSNLGAVADYNATFRVTLPVGVTYQSGSTSPTSFNDPTIYTDAVSHAQTLVWLNVADLQVDSTISLGFKAIPSSVTYPVASTVTAVADVFASADPRLIPKFDAAGLPIPAANVVSDQGRTVVSNVSAIEITKSEPSPESELLRGVHNNTTVYTVKVTNNSLFPTNSITVTDYLPAALEFLACGGVDNTPGGTPEYPGAPSLTATPAVSGCVQPNSVDTVSNPPANGSQTYPPGVYTKLTWNLSNLTAGQVVTLTYGAGIPLLSNTMAFTPSTPTGASGRQGANLSNNTGAPTREAIPEKTATNLARAAGTYTGPVFSGGSTSVESTISKTVSVEDVAMVKSASTGTFSGDGIVTYSLKVRVSEYVSASSIVVTDVSPNGLCPLSSTSNFATGSPADCAAVAGSDPTGASFASVTQNPDGTFTSVFTPIAVAPDGTATITYRARMRSTYTGGALAGQPTVAGDSFTNNASLTATTTPVPATGQGGSTQTVGDTSSATLSTDGLSIDKKIMPRTLGADCSTGPYVESNDPAYTASDFTFRKGTRVCFQLAVTFPTTTSTKNPVVTDVVPQGTSYEPGSMTVVTSPGSNVSFNEAAATAGTADPTWNLGDPSGSSLFVPKGQTFLVHFSVIVGAASTTGTVDIAGNLMKFRSASTPGQATSLRDQVDFGIAPPPPVSIVKGVYKVNGAPALGNGPNVDGVQVKEGDTVTFRVDVTNNGTAATATDFSINGVNIWDVLPAGITCAQISNISRVGSDPTSPVGTCTNPGDPGQPSFTGNTTQSAITWVFRSGVAGDPEKIEAGASRTLTYGMTVPSGVSVASVLTNTAAVRSFDAFTDLLDVTSTYYPKSNIDTTVPVASQDALAASDTSNVFLPAVTVSKAIVSSSITDTNNNGGSQATNGETITYRYSASVPAGTTVYNGALTDVLPAGFTLVTSSAAFNAAGSSPASGLLPVGSVFTSATGALTLPATFDNTAPTSALFEVTLTARVGPSVTTGNKVNTATFTSDSKLTGGVALTPKTATATAVVVQFLPTLTKTNNSGANAAAGQVVTYTLTAGNTSGRPPAYDTVVVDCVPAGLTFNAWGAPSQGTVDPATPGTGAAGNGCAVGTTKLSWNVGAIAPAATKTVTYTATVDPASAGAVVYTNTAVLTASSLNDGVNDGSTSAEKVTSVSKSSNVTVQGPTTTKSVLDPTRTVGQLATYTVNTVVPANVNFYAAALIDTLPAGLDPTTVTVVSSSCLNADTTTCSATPTALTPSPGPGGSTLVGWGFGDVLSSSQARTLQVVYTVKVKDVAGNTAGTTLTNSAKTSWNTTTGALPTSAGATWTKSGTPATASFIMTEPNVTPTKTVDDTTVEPGQTFNYTVTATNSSATNTSTAHNVVVTDTVPVGVVVQSGTITGGGVLTGSGVNGGGVITWNVATPMAPGASVSYTYASKLAPSSTLTSAGLLNTVKVNGYDSLSSGGRHYTGTTATRTVTPQFPVLTTVKSTPSGTTAYVGSPLDFTVAVSVAQATATTVNVTDTLPANWNYVPASAQVTYSDGTSAQVDPTISTSGAVTTLTWPDLGSAAPGETVSVFYQATPTVAALTNPGAGSSIAHVNSAKAFSGDATGAVGNLTGPYQSNTASATARISSADLSITKTHTGAIAAGTTFTWKLHATNNGPDTAVGPFTVNDTLPAGVTLSNATGTGWSCSVTSPITCARTNPADTLASGVSFPDINVVVSVPSNAVDGATISNTATVSARTYDPQLSNNTSTDSVTLSNQADLGINKAFTSPVVAGQAVSWSLTVANHGPSDSTGPVVVTDTLPAGTTPTNASGTGWSCSISGQLVTCDLPAGLPANSSAEVISLTANLYPSFTGTLSNTAHVSGPITDPNPVNDSSTTSSSTDTSADVSIVKTHVGDMLAGTSDRYHLVVANNGPSDARSLVVTDQLPAGLTGTSATGTGWSCSISPTELVTCSLPTLAAGASTSIDVDVDLDAGVTGTVVNTASVSTTTPDPNPGNNTSTDSSTATAKADLEVSKTHTGTAVAGRDLTFTVTVKNNGPSNSPGTVEVIDTLPAGMTPSSATGSGWSCSISGQDVTCDLAAGLNAHATAPVVSLTVAIAPDAGPATLTNHVSVSGPLTDPTPGNNTATDDVVVTDSANVSIVKTVTGDMTVNAGQGTSFQLKVVNDGPSDADSVTVTDTLPTGMTFSSPTTGSGWSCLTTGSSVTCTRPTLAAGSTSFLDVSTNVGASVPAGTHLVNDSEVSTATPGDLPGDNTSSAGIDVTASADLAITKAHDPTVVDAGQVVTWTLHVTNAGPSNAVGPLTVTDTLPDGLVLLSTDGGWDCSLTGQVLTCSLPAGLPASSAAPDIRVRTLVDSNVSAGDLVNTADVSSPTTDPNVTDNTATNTVTVTVNADISVTKTHTGNGTVGAPSTFTLVVSNTGPSTATGVVITDTLPPGLTYLSAAPQGTDPIGACVSAPGANSTTTVTCPLTAGIAPSSSVTLYLTATVEASAYPSVTNVVAVTSETPDTNVDDNHASDTLLVDPLADLALTKTHVGTAPFVVGQTGTYLLTVTNNGPTRDEGPLLVTDTLPNGLAFVSGIGTSWACSATGQVVTCSSASGIDPGGTSTITMVVNVLPAAAGSLSNSASVTGTGTDPNLDNNTSTDVVQVLPLVDLSLVKTASAMNSARQITWTLTVTNRGPNIAPAPIIVSDNLINDLRFVSATGSGWSCSASGQVVTCQRAADLGVNATAPGITLVTSVVAGVPVGTTLTNTATVGLPGGVVVDVNPGNNTAGASTSVPDTGGVGGRHPDTGAGNIVQWALLALTLLGLGVIATIAGRRPKRQ